ncbi:MAG TPA: sugar phosphate isomerase/epimerase family protein [Roseiflexaceae bacterium]|nr:sugar phosphate isomerase/epimerase family protein [Roseiflexaceae bacterium]
MSLRIGENPIGLAAYSMPWRCGFAGAGTARACPAPLDAYDLLELAAEHGLAAVELPIAALLPDLEPGTLAAFKARADALGLAIVVDYGVVDVPALERLIPAAAALGARTLRVMLSTILEGARAAVPGGWEAYLERMIAELRRLRPLAEAHGVTLAPENHQDATSDDLLRVCEEVGGDCIGVTLDAVNPLAVGEEPLAFARKLGPRIVNVHLKDYHIYLTESGFRLVRCPLGEGVLDLRGLFALLAEVAPHATCNIELAALHARHIRLLEDDWWAGFPARDVRNVLPALRMAVHHARPAGEEWRTPWERECGADELAAYEEGQVAASVAYLRGLGVRG